MRAMTEPAGPAPPGAVACPYLGLLEDRRTRFLFATPAHRCLSRRRPAAIDLDHQLRYCLSADFATCKRYRKPALDAALEAAPATPVMPVEPPPDQVARAPRSALLSVVATTRPAVAAPESVTRTPAEPIIGATTHREIDEPEAPQTAPHRPVPDILLPVGEPEPGAWRPPGDSRSTVANPARHPDPRTNWSVVGRRILLLVAVVVLAVVLWAVLSPSIQLFAARPG